MTTPNAQCERCECCTAHLCAVAVINREACVRYGLAWTAEMELMFAQCPCAPRGVQYPARPTSNVIPFPTSKVAPREVD